MTSREHLLKALNHQETDKIPMDMGSSPVSGIHVKALEKLRKYYGLNDHPVRVIEPYQMLGLVEKDLIDAVGIDVIGAWSDGNLFGYNNLPPLKVFKTPWGQEVLVPESFNTTPDEEGNYYSYPGGDTSVEPSAKMPTDGYFFDALERQKELDEDQLNVEDNLEEFSPVTPKEIEYWKNETKKLRQTTDKAIVAALGTTALGDIALVPGMQLKNPRGIRSVAEWYMSTIMRVDYIKTLFDRQSVLAIENLEKLHNAIGDNMDIIYMCGTDFGTQESSFCSPEQFDDIWLPYYKRMNDWIHAHTNWKTFKHSCGAVEPFMSSFIKAGFDIINPVQVNAKGMDPKLLEDRYGKHVTFWGGGVDTQQVLPYRKPEDVREQVLRHCEIFSKGGGFVFNTVHNIQADVPVENLVAMIDAVKEFNN
jgi:uroporphyrinogen-III decarboxylase